MGKNWLYCTFSLLGVLFFFCLFFNKKHGRCILCLVILGVLLIFCFEGNGASQAIQREHGSRGHLNGKSWVSSTQKRRSQTLLFWVNTQAGKETYLNFHSSSQLLKNVLPEPLDLISLQFGQPNLYDTWAEPANPDHDQEMFHPREGDNFKNKQTVFSTARDFQLDSHVTSLPHLGNKISDETATPYYH